MSPTTRVADAVDRRGLQHLEQAPRDGDRGDQQRNAHQGAGLGVGDQLVDGRLEHRDQAGAQAAITAALSRATTSRLRRG
jgi:hypothetical protein